MADFQLADKELASAYCGPGRRKKEESKSPFAGSKVAKQKLPPCLKDFLNRYLRLVANAAQIPVEGGWRRLGSPHQAVLNVLRDSISYGDIESTATSPQLARDSGVARTHVWSAMSDLDAACLIIDHRLGQSGRPKKKQYPWTVTAEFVMPPSLCRVTEAQWEDWLFRPENEWIIEDLVGSPPTAKTKHTVGLRQLLLVNDASDVELFCLTGKGSVPVVQPRRGWVTPDPDPFEGLQLTIAPEIEIPDDCDDPLLREFAEALPLEDPDVLLAIADLSAPERFLILRLEQIERIQVVLMNAVDAFNDSWKVREAGTTAVGRNVLTEAEVRRELKLSGWQEWELNDEEMAEARRSDVSPKLQAAVRQIEASRRLERALTHDVGILEEADLIRADNALEDLRFVLDCALGIANGQGEGTEEFWPAFPSQARFLKWAVKEAYGYLAGLAPETASVCRGALTTIVERRIAALRGKLDEQFADAVATCERDLERASPIAA